MKKQFLLLVLFVAIYSFGQDLALARDKDLFGYINRKGEMVIKNQYKIAKSFSDDLAAVLIEEKWGFINKKGEIVIQPIYDKVKEFDAGIAIVLQNKIWKYIDKKGADITNFPPSDKPYDFSQGRAIIREGEKVGIIDNKGKVIVKPEYEVIKPFENGFAKVRKFNRWGYINLEGKEVISCDYDNIGECNLKTTWGKKGKIYGIISNNTFKSLEVDDIWDYNEEEIAYARKDKVVGFINEKGDWIIIPQYQKAKAMVKGIAPVMQGGKWGFINLKGEFIVQPIYSDAEIFSKDGFAPVKTDKWGFINTKGELKISPIYTITVGGFQIFNYQEKGFYKGLARVKSTDGWGYIDINGNLLGNKWFQNLELFN
jgi:WG containing repeat